MLKNIPKSIESGIHFVNISKDKHSILSYKTEFSTKHHFFDIKIGHGEIAKIKNHFYHLHKGDHKIVYKKGSHGIIFSVGADVSMQYQVLEALLDELIEQFNLSHADTVKYYFDSGSQQNFQEFSKNIDYTIKNFHSLNLVSYVQIFCTACKRNHIIAVKNSLIKNSEKSIVPLVYYHNGIPILIYIDQDFNIRGIEQVSITG